MSTLEVFCCYARKDEDILSDLKKQLMPLQRQGIINLWTDADISPGTEWEAEINTRLHNAHIILLLISPDFMVSDYCYSKEMSKAMERHDNGEARVIPVILRPTYWQAAPFARLQALPKDAVPIKSASWYSMDEALFFVVKGILQVIETYGHSETTESTNEEQKLNKESTEKVILTGFVDLDRLTGGLRGSDLIIIGGISLSGKSSVALNILSHAALKKGHSVGMISLQSKQERIFQHLLALNTGIYYQDIINGWATAEQWERIVAITNELERAAIWIDDPATLTIPELRTYLLQAQQKAKTDLLIIDSIEFLLKEEGHYPKRYIATKHDTEELSFSLKALARELDIPIIALVRKEYQLPLKSPLPKDAIDSYADIALYIHREEQRDEFTDLKNIMDIIVTKNRYGLTGEISLYFNSDTMSVCDLQVSLEDEAV